MKFNRIVVLAVLGLLALNFHGCGGEEKPVTKDEQPKPAEISKGEEVVTVPEAKPEHKEYTKEDFFVEGEGFKWELIEELHQKYENNRCLKHLVLNKEKVDSLTEEQQVRVYDITKSGLLLADDSSVGVYAQTASDYDEYDWLLKAIMYDYQKADETKVHHESWVLPRGTVTSVGDGSKTYSLRIRVARNPKGVPLPASCTEEDFLRIENQVSEVLETMQLPSFKTKFDNPTSTIYTLTKDHPKAGTTVTNKVKTGSIPILHKADRETKYVFVDYDEEGQTEYKGYQAKGIFSGDPTSDPALSVGEINRAFPQGRATWDYTDGTTTIRIYINEEDTLRIQMLTKGNDVGNLFYDMKNFLDYFEYALKKKDAGLAFAKDEKLGYLASCPSNVGTGMRASAQMLIPAQLAAAGYDINDNSEENQKKGAEVLTEMSNSKEFKGEDLQLRGGLGEYTAPGKGGKIDLSYKKRTFVTEADIIMKLIKAMQYTEGLEAKAEKAAKKSLRRAKKQAKLAAKQA